MTTPSTQPFPRLVSEFVNPDRTLSYPWYRLLITLWQRTGGSVVSTTGSAFLNLVGSLLDAYRSSDGTRIGTVQMDNSAGGPAAVQVLGASPFIFTAPICGTLLVESGQIEFSRDSGANWYVFGLAGGATHLMAGDQVRVTWYNVAPKVVWMPGASG